MLISWFSQKVFPQNVNLFEWCPNKDLCLTSYMNKVCLYRIYWAADGQSWQRIKQWDEPDIQCLVWNPEGTLFAIGTRNQVKLYCAETLTLLHTWKQPASRMHWLSIKQNPLETIIIKNPLENIINEFKEHPSKLLGNQLNLLLACFDHSVKLSLFGLFYVASLQLNGPCLGCWSPTDLTRLALVYQVDDSIMLHVHDLTRLLQVKQELILVAQKSVAVNYMSRLLEDSLNSLIEKFYKKSEKFYLNQIKIFWESFGGKEFPNLEFLNLLATGIPSQQFTTFLVQGIEGELNVAKWYKLLEQSYEAIKRQLVSLVIPSIEKLLILLQDLVAVGKWMYQMHSIQFDVKKMELLIEQLLSILQLCNSMLSCLVDYQEMAYEFKQWLIHTVQVIKQQQEEPLKIKNELIVKFLQQKENPLKSYWKQLKQQLDQFKQEMEQFFHQPLLQCSLPLIHQQELTKKSCSIESYPHGIYLVDKHQIWIINELEKSCCVAVEYEIKDLKWYGEEWLMLVTNENEQCFLASFHTNQVDFDDGIQLKNGQKVDLKVKEIHGKFDEIQSNFEKQSIAVIGRRQVNLVEESSLNE